MPLTTTAVKDHLENLSRKTLSCNGPFRLMRQSDVEDPTTNRMTNKIIDEIDRKNNHWSAPSAWHVALFLQNLAQQAAMTPVNFGQQSNVLNRGNLVFRGQRQSAWDLQSSIERLDEWTMGRHVAANWLFAMAVHAAIDFEEYPTTNPSSYIGVAQHFGVINTPFIDFTADPLTALFFAHHHGEFGSKAKIFILPIHTVIKRAANIYLAPHWIQRIHRQMGLFVDAREIASSSLPQLCYTIEFPIEQEFVESGFLPSPVKIYPENVWFTKLSEWALEQLIDMPVKPVSWKESVGVPDFLIDLIIPARCESWVKFSLQLMQCLALRYENGNFAVDIDILATIRKHNPGWFKAIAPVYETIQQLNIECDGINKRFIETIALFAKDKS